jgi:hypothetical protein
MNLDEFISQTLTEIINGVISAQKACTDKSAAIAPRKSARDPDYQNVDFDIAVTVEKGTQTKGKIGVLSIISLGAAGQSDNSQTAINRIKFSVPVYLPYVPGAGIIADSKSDY